MKIFLKIFTSYLILILLTVAVLDFFLMPKINRLMTNSIEDEMLGMARMMTMIPQENIKGKVTELSKQLNVRITIIDAAGKVISESNANQNRMDNHLTRPEIVQAKTQGQGKASRFSTTLQESMLYVAVPTKENKEIKGYVRLSRPLVMVRKSLDHLNWALYMTLYIIALPSLLLSFVFSRKIYKRIMCAEEKQREKI
jgi:two-component system phosphate regulon sensor histidine kinase PhoR